MMNMTSRLSLNRPSTTLLDLAKPNLGKREERAFSKALKKAHKDQEAVRKKAKDIIADK